MLLLLLVHFWLPSHSRRPSARCSCELAVWRFVCLAWDPRRRSRKLPPGGKGDSMGCCDRFHSCLQSAGRTPLAGAV